MQSGTPETFAKSVQYKVQTIYTDKELTVLSSKRQQEKTIKKVFIERGQSGGRKASSTGNESIDALGKTITTGSQAVGVHNTKRHSVNG
jgi:hypothetical protein